MSKIRKRWILIIVFTVIAIVAISVGLIVWMIGVDLFSYDHDNITKLNVIEVVQKEYDCDKVVWYQRCDNNSVQLLPDDIDIASKEFYAVIAEKDGDEIFLIIPSETDKEKGFIAEWAFDYSFNDIIEKMATVGVICEQHGNGINSRMYDDIGIFDITLDGANEEFYNRFDVKLYLSYYFKDDEENSFSCFVMQENHELKIYLFDGGKQEYILLC